MDARSLIKLLVVTIGLLSIMNLLGLYWVFSKVVVIEDSQTLKNNFDIMVAVVAISLFGNITMISTAIAVWLTEEPSKEVCSP